MKRNTAPSKTGVTLAFWKGREYRRGNTKLNNPEKQARYGTQDDEKQSKNTT